MEDIFEEVKLLKKVSYKFANLPTEIKNSILEEIKDSILKNLSEIYKNNEIDVQNAIKKGMSPALIDRLTLKQKNIEEIIKGIDTVISLEDPVNKVIEEWTRPQGFKIKKYRVPLGVIFMIYESRPNVTVDSAVLCIKSGNCTILRGGSEAINTNKTLVKIISDSISKILEKYKINFLNKILLFIDNPSYDLMYKLLEMHDYIDLVIPRGSEEMVRNIKSHSLIPVLSHGSGICHIYVDEYADVEKSVKVCFNAKVQRPSVCNAMETLLVHRNIAEKFLPVMTKKYIEHKVELRGCEETVNLLKKFGIVIKPATEEDWRTEYLDLILSIKIVSSIDEAIEHINNYGSHHSDGIMTENEENKEKFLKEVDSSAIFINSSTRLHDGGVFGFGTEIGISTSKFHARGTMGLKELTTTKYVVIGDGHVRE